jgi:hypothetical protein
MPTAKSRNEFTGASRRLFDRCAETIISGNYVKAFMLLVLGIVAATMVYFDLSSNPRRAANFR